MKVIRASPDVKAGNVCYMTHEDAIPGRWYLCRNGENIKVKSPEEVRAEVREHVLQQLYNQDMQRLQFSISKIGDDEASRFVPPVAGTSTDEFGINFYPDSTESVFRVSHIDQSNCQFEHYPEDHSVLGGMAFHWQAASVLRSSYAAFISNSGRRLSAEDSAFQISEQCIAYLAGKCQNPKGCHRVHIKIQGCDISQASACKQGLVALPLPHLDSIPAARASSDEWPDNIKQHKIETRVLEARVEALEDENGPVSETRLQGKFVLLYFSAGWCPPCRAFSPQLSEFRKENEEDVEESTNTAPLFPCLILLSLIRWCL